MLNRLVTHTFYPDTRYLKSQKKKNLPVNIKTIPQLSIRSNFFQSFSKKQFLSCSLLYTILLSPVKLLLEMLLRLLSI
jgi:hypothetical protein